MTTRFLLTVISSFYFNGEKTLSDLHEEIAKDASKLYFNGVDVACQTFWIHTGFSMYRLVGDMYHMVVYVKIWLVGMYLFQHLLSSHP